MKDDITREYMVKNKIHGVPTFIFINSDGSTYMKLTGPLAKRQIVGMAAQLE